MRRQKEQKIHSKKRIWVVPVLLSAALLETIAVYAGKSGSYYKSGWICIVSGLLAESRWNTSL